MIKIVSLLLCLILFPVTSILWRLIIGIFLGAVISRILLFTAKVKSSVTYLFDYEFLIRIAAWFYFILLFSSFQFHPFDIKTSDNIYFAVFAIVLFDCIMMQLVGLLLGKYSSKSLIKQYPEIEQKIKEGFRLYNDIPVVSAVYPLFKWIFG